MELTKGQCWDIIRKLVSDKNKEYASFLAQTIGTDNLPLAIGYTKSAYLGKFGLSGEDNFRYIIKNRGIKPKKEWLDNLSTEDLLIFLDFRCRSLQQMYDLFNKQGNLSLEDVKNIIISTKRSSLINYNAGRLKATGRPEYAEYNLSSLEIDDEMIKQALLQVMDQIAIKHAKMVDISEQSARDQAYTLTTSNINCNNTITGYKLKSVNNIKSSRNQVDKISDINSNINIDDGKPHLVGYDIFMHHIFIKNGKYVNLIGDELKKPEIVYDADKNKIIYEKQSDYKRDVFVGLDINGSPVFEDDNGYYNSIGERLPDDEYIQSTDDILSR